MRQYDNETMCQYANETIKKGNFSALSMPPWLHSFQISY